MQQPIRDGAYVRTFHLVAPIQPSALKTTSFIQPAPTTLDKLETTGTERPFRTLDHPTTSLLRDECAVGPHNRNLRRPERHIASSRPLLTFARVVGHYALAAIIPALWAFMACLWSESQANHSQHRRQLPHHQLSSHPDHPVAEPLQLSVPPRVSPRAASVIPAVHLYDEPDTGRAEVDDVLADDDLPPKRDAQTAAAELSPEQRLRGGGSDSHGAGARSEELSTSTAHRNLRGPGKGPDHAASGAGSVTRPSPLAQICRLIFTLASGSFAGAAQNVRHWRGPALSPGRGPSVAAATPRLASRPRAAHQPASFTTPPFYRRVLPPGRLDLPVSVLLHPRASARALARASTDLEEAGERSAAKPREHPPGGGREWDGDDLVHERVHDDDGTVTSPVTTWVFEPGMFTPLAKLEGRTRFGIVTDHLGTPAILTTEAGAIAWRAQLDVYGVVREEEGVARDEDRTANPWRFPGQYEDAETGLYYNRFRYYDPELGRYLSEDPIGLRGGVGLFGYVHDPLWWLDVLGLACVKSNRKAGKDAEDFVEDVIGTLFPEFTRLGKQVSVRTTQGRRVVDFVYEGPGKVLYLIEVKSGRAARSTAQKKKQKTP